MTTVQSDYFYLCGACGSVTSAGDWEMFHYTEAGKRRPHEPADSDPVLECPVCKYNFTDDDSGPAMYDGTRDQCDEQREALLAEADDPHGYGRYAEDWAETLEKTAWLR